MEPLQLVDALRQRPELRRAWLGRLNNRVETDSRINSLWLVGSLASDEADEWSDIDLILYCERQVIDERQSLAQVAEILLEWDAPQNAAEGSMHYCTVYDLGPLPFGVDWHLWPKGSPRPSDAKPLVAENTLKTSPLTFSEIQKRAAYENRTRAVPEMSPEQTRQFRLSMLYPICKDLARGWPQSSATMVEWLGFVRPDGTLEGWITSLNAILRELAEDFPPRVCEKYENLLHVTEWAARERYA